MYIYIYLYIVYTYIYIYIYIHVYIYPYMYVYIYIYIYDLKAATDKLFVAAEEDRTASKYFDVKHLSTFKPLQTFYKAHRTTF